MPWGAAAVVGAAVVGSMISADASQSAASTQANAATQAANTQAQASTQQQANLLAAGQQAAQQFTPYANYGTTALNNLASNNAYFNKQFSNADLNANIAPNYAFQLGQGQEANLRASNVTGGAQSGNALKALQDYTQNYAANAYQNAFNNFQTQRGNISAIDLANTNVGLAGATGSANAQIGTATNIANLGIGSANAQAAGINAAAQANAAGQIGAANAYGGAVNTLGNIGYMYAQNQASQPFNANSVWMGSSTPGGSFTPTAGNSFTLA